MNINNNQNILLISAISLRKKYFNKYLKLTINDPDCTNTHQLSTSLKRLLVVNNITKMVYGSALIPPKKLNKIKKFRRRLAAIRDNHELLIKLKNLSLSNPFLNYVINQLETEQYRLETKITRHCRRLKKLKIGEYFRKSYITPIINTKTSIPVKPVLEDLLKRTLALQDEAIKNSNDKALHNLRIRYKAYRYSYELLAPTLTSITSKRLDYLRTIQTALGEAHDWLVAAQIISNISEPEDFPGKTELAKKIAHRLKSSNRNARNYFSQETERLHDLSQLT